MEVYEPSSPLTLSGEVENSLTLLMCDLLDALYRGILTSKNNRSRISII